MKINIFITIIIFIIIVVIYINYDNYQIEEDYHSNNHIQFMTKEDVCHFFRSDPDNYFHSFNTLNLNAYGYNNINDYIESSCKSASDFTNSEKKYIISQCEKGDNFLQTFNKIDKFPSKKVAGIKWIFAKTNDRVYEKGYPHTREGIIFLPTDILQEKNLAQVLVHEKIHVFSRLFPKDMAIWNEKNGYILHRKLKDYPMARNNPDVDGFVYLDKNKKETLAQYTTMNPKTIEEAVYPYLNDYKTEHPNEVLAYQVDSYLS